VGRVFLEYQGDNIELPVGETVIGRDVSCTLRFNDPSVSRRHVRLVRRADHVFVQDLGSTNGTVVNGKPISGAVRLEDGDEVTIGSRQVIVRVAKADDDEQPDTLTLKDFSPQAEIAKLRNATLRMPVTVPPPVRRLPTRPGLDARRHQRHQIQLQLAYVSDELEIDALTSDLSISGVFVCTDVLDPVGTACRLTILIDGGPPLVLGGTVRRVVVHDSEGDEPVGMGVEFVQLGANELVWLEKTIAKIEAAAS
jgi:hypothetical protein